MALNKWHIVSPGDEVATPRNTKGRTRFSNQVEAKVTRKLRAWRNSSRGEWFGLGLMGLIGWSLTIPTLIGAALGLWLDKQYPGSRSLTLSLLMAGLSIGSFNAWRWVDKEDRAMQEEQENNNDDA